MITADRADFFDSCLLCGDGVIAFPFNVRQTVGHSVCGEREGGGGGGEEAGEWWMSASPFFYYARARGQGGGWVGVFGVCARLRGLVTADRVDFFGPWFLCSVGVITDLTSGVISFLFNVQRTVGHWVCVGEENAPGGGGGDE